ncbi:hypothetical protein HS088_TW04G01349 [Tripterygium wilfordii]|uniref:FAS1 domain-containing protein n=1 Tax=Tripterygium wilfordii TaxID=458696 RepID=A0A7J7DSN6_TRIWF|nr:hypothetical protein HS088_TW04G01349 [Tripterygium wilfordii]
MANNKTTFLLLFFFFFLLSTILLPAKASQEDSNMQPTQYGSSGVNISGIVSALAHKAHYEFASQTLEATLSSLIGKKNSSFTIFCPKDSAYASLRYAPPPPTLVAYHITPNNLQREDLELRSDTLRMYSRIDTLLPGHPLVAQLNLVNIIDWNIYDDGRVIVHGIDGFFDPSVQAILFPWLEHDETIKREEEGSFNIAHHPLGFLAIFVLCVFAVSELFFWAYLCGYGRREITTK